MFYFHLFGINIVWNNWPTVLYCSLMPTSPPRTVTMLSPTRWAHQSCSSLRTDLWARKSAAVPTVTSPTTPTRASGFPSGSSAALRWVPTLILASLSISIQSFHSLQLLKYVVKRSFWWIKTKSIISCQFQDDQTGLVHLQDSDRKTVYDPFLGSFLTPDWSNLHKYIHQPERFLLYRINGNDPLNSPKRAAQSGNITNSLDIYSKSTTARRRGFQM